MRNITRIFILVLLFSAFNNIQAQTYEEWLKQEQANYSQFRNEQQKMLQKLRDDYSNYVKKRDKEYSDYLKKEWERYQVFTGKTPPERPEPKVIPEYKPTPGAPVSPIPLITTPLAIPLNIPPLVKLPVIQKPEPVDYPEDAFSINFCGAKVNLNIDQDLKNILTEKKGKQAITDFWDRASKTNYNALLNQLMAAKSKFNVNDYGYFMLIQAAAVNMYPPEQIENRLLIEWFLMVRSGYDVRIAYNDNQIAILMPTYNTLYSKPYITINNLNFYFISPFEGNDIQTYNKSYDLANTPVDFNIPNPMNFGSKPVTKTIAIKYNGKDYNFGIAFDPGVVEFFKDYPQVDMEVYFNAAVSLVTKESIIDSFKPILQDISEPDAVNFLLNFVQNGFEYKTAQEQFGKEKIFFADEMFYYPFSDCGDRAVLFAYMVRNLLALKVVGLESPNHLFTAVHFNATTNGDNITYKGEKYIVADPTYINAPYGSTMPEVRLENVKIVTMNNAVQESLTSEKAWNIAARSGILKASNAQNLVFDKLGNFYVTGYFNSLFKMGSFHAEGSIDLQSCIVAKIDVNGNLLWADPLKSSGNAVGLAVELDKNGNLFVAGSYNGNFLNLSSGKNSDIFLAKYNKNGERSWLSSAGLDTIPKGAGLIYSLGFDKNGNKGGVRIVEYSPTYNGYGLFVNDTSVIFNGAIHNTLVPMKSTLAVNSTAEMDYPELLKKEYDRFIAQQTDRCAAGLFAISNIIKNPGMIISGKEVQKTFDKYNPEFKERCPNIYKLIGKITFIKNANNIITLLTDNGGDVLFNKLKLSNNSQLRISLLPNGNAEVDALTGIKVGKMIIWYPLNFIRIFSKTGDLLFDYDRDHSQAKMNLKKDILN